MDLLSSELEVEEGVVAVTSKANSGYDDERGGNYCAKGLCCGIGISIFACQTGDRRNYRSASYHRKNNKEDIVLEKKRGGGVGKSVSAKEVQKCLSECRHILEFKEH